MPKTWTIIVLMRLDFLSVASNFRDLGGYIGLDGRPLRWRKLFRSDHLGSLTADDVVTVSALNVQRVFDFRGAQERLAQPCALPRTTIYPLSIEPTVVQRITERLETGGTLTAPEMVGLMQQTYRDFVRHNTPRFKTLFAHLLASDAPLVFHCTAGKDRTGFAAALILRSLGVPHDVVMEDYLLTNALLKMPPNAGSPLPEEVRAVLYRVQAVFLAAAMDVVEQEHSGIEAYLTNEMGLGKADRAQLGRLYLAG
jgi:protein-tyrosine phosphatase